MKNKSIKDYEIFVFDLDNTLYLHKVDPVYNKSYISKVKNILCKLKANNKKIWIATHNTDPYDTIDKMDIKHLLDGVVQETKDVNPHVNDICEYTSKKDMILEIIKNYKEYKLDDILFFDDDMYNIIEVENINVTSIYLGRNKGLNFVDFEF